MDAPEPDTPFAAVSAQTTKFQRVSRSCEHVGRVSEQTETLQSQRSPCTDTRTTDVPKLPGQVHTIHHIPLDRNSNRLHRLWSPDSVCAGMVYRYVRSRADKTRHSKLAHTRQKIPEQPKANQPPHAQSPTPSASTS